jgi:hypothetical protein
MDITHFVWMSVNAGALVFGPVIWREHRRLCDQWCKSEGFEMKLHPPGLYLREVENVVDQRKQVTGRAENAVEGLGVLL